MTSPFAGTLPKPEQLADIPALLEAYYDQSPDPSDPSVRVSFGTSGHRGSSVSRTFNEAHILAITQAICDIRAANNLRGPLFLGMDTHALSSVAMETALEVLAANKVTVFIEENSSVTPTPVISHAILSYNRLHREATRADGIIITPSHNPPSDGGIKYNPPTGGPAPTSLTQEIESRANKLLAAGNRDVRSISSQKAEGSGYVLKKDLIGQYVDDLANVLDMESIARSGLTLGADPLGGSSLHVWERIAENYRLPLAVTNKALDPSFSFIPLDHDGKTRMDCSSPYAMSGLLAMKDKYDLAFACDPDADRHGIVTRDGLMNPNHYLSAAVWHLFQSRPGWNPNSGIGKTVVTSAMLNRVAASLGRQVYEVPVGFKWFVPYLLNATCGMGCEESAGASFLRFDGRPWSTDKDGPLLCLLAAEMMAKHKKSPYEIYKDLTVQHGAPAYARADSALAPEKRARFSALTAESLPSAMLAGDKITSVLTHAPANSEPIGGIKVSTEEGWFAARPSGTEPICKVYTESFLGEEHRKRIEKDAIAMLGVMLA